MAPQRSRNWCFTINNHDNTDEDRLSTLSEKAYVKYLVYGREVGESGTRHLQGFIIFKESKSAHQVKSNVGARAHVEIARGQPYQAADYCKKGNDYEEFGDTPRGNGYRSDTARFEEWARSLTTRPSDHEVIRRFPGLWMRSGVRLFDIINAFLPQIPLVAEDAELNEWQSELLTELDQEVNDRRIVFYVDEEGNKGKSFFCRYCMTKRDDVQILRVGKRDDLAHAIDPNKKVFLFDVQRSELQFLQYSVLEMLKDRMIFSPKYHSQTKILLKKPFVVVFCNEEPDMTKLSADRYEIRNI